MASTKDAVTDFLQLGAKYELILAGLYDDLNRQRPKLDEALRRYDETVGTVRQATELLESARDQLAENAQSVRQVRDGLEQMRSSFRNSQEELLRLSLRVRRLVFAHLVLSLSFIASLVATLTF